MGTCAFCFLCKVNIKCPAVDDEGMDGFSTDGKGLSIGAMNDGSVDCILNDPFGGTVGEIKHALGDKTCTVKWFTNTRVFFEE